MNVKVGDKVKIRVLFAQPRTPFCDTTEGKVYDALVTEDCGDLYVDFTDDVGVKCDADILRRSRNFEFVEDVQ